MKPTLYLVRHAQSYANVDAKVLQEKTNVGIEITDNGIVQAKQTGEFLSQHFLASNLDHKMIKVWNSPYHRTRQTAAIIKQQLVLNNINFEQEESIHIAERQFGLVDDAIDYPTHHPREFAHFQLHHKEKKTFFARPPLGESPFDLCQRIDFFLRVIVASEPQYQHVIVTHGAAVRALIMMSQKLPYEQYLEMTNPYNASVRLINGEEGDQGEVFRPNIESY
jgi:broad specificity phosphatase PhoE